MIRILVFLLLLTALTLPASAAVSSGSSGDDDAIALVGCSSVHHRVSSAMGAGASGTAHSLQRTIRAAADCTGDCVKQAGCLICRIHKFAGRTITSAENYLQNFSTEVLSQSLQLLRNALSSLWALVLDLLHF